MHSIRTSNILVYPVKSLAGITLQECDVFRAGLRFDRRWAVVNANHEIITGREYPKLLGISAELHDAAVLLKAPDKREYQLNSNPDHWEEVEVRLFKRSVPGLRLGTEVADWLSTYLGIACELIMLGRDGLEMQAKYGGKDGDIVSYADTSPIHLVSEESLRDLNTRLEYPVLMNRFRPNVIVQGGLPYEEDQWKRIRIGNCEFEVNEHCKRCVFTTVDPEIQRKDPQQEPLRTLSSYRKNEAGAVTFGINLTPRQLGKLEVGQTVEVINT